MAIKSHQGPSNGQIVMANALAVRLPLNHATISTVGGDLQVGGPLPFYHLALDQLPLDNALDHAIRTGWRYPAIVANATGLVDIRGSEGTNSAVFGGLLYGVVAERLIKAAVLAEGALANKPEEYEPRLLDVPALSFLALWLRSSQGDWFISLLEGEPPSSAALQLVREVLPQLRARAASRVNQKRSPSSSPTN